MNRTMWILAGVLVVLLIVLIFVLTSGDGSDGDVSTTTASATTTTTTDLDTTTSITDTTTTALETTTTVVETTTTAAEETTTTETETGNWADEPIVVAGFGALGWWDGSRWVQAGSGDALPVAGGEDYQVAVLDLTATTTGGAQQVVCDPLENIGVVLAHEELLGDWPGPYGVAISAPWTLTPHLVESIEDDGTYAIFAAELLAERGLVVTDPVIKQLLRVDLEGDGVNEVLVVAEDTTLDFFGEAGDYSIVFMRKVVEGDVETAVLAEAIVLDPEAAFGEAFDVGSVADLNGDGKMEIVVSSAYYEGLGVAVFEYVNDDLGPVLQIAMGCGA